MQRYATLISTDELHNNLDAADWRIVDCRFELAVPDKGRQDYLGGHIPGATYANLDRDLAGPVRNDSGRHPLPNPEVFATTLGQWGISNTSQVVAYDQASGAIAARLWWLLRWLGHSDVAVLNGGMAAWTSAGLPLELSRRQASPAEFVQQCDDSRVLDTAELSGDPGGILLVDARERTRFQGLQEPIDRVAGHVPGAINLPYTELLGPDKGFLSPEALRLRWASVLGGATEEPWAAMCGSGVTACHLALAAEVAGIKPPRLYVGSWSEWIRDSARPVVTGP
jgi:thiosulfate/3-mercaptopyruvate sulfurtransferase